MNLSIVLLSTLSTILLALLMVQQWWHQRVISRLLEQQSQNLSTQQELHNKATKMLTDLNSKAQSLLSSKDPMTFQQIQAMNQTTDYSGYSDYDPSDEAEVERIAQRNPNLAAGEDIDGREARQLFAELTGIDPEFYGN